MSPREIRDWALAVFGFCAGLIVLFCALVVACVGSLRIWHDRGLVAPILVAELLTVSGLVALVAHLLARRGDRP